MTTLNPPHGGSLTGSMLDPARIRAVREEAIGYPSIDLNAFQLGDLELLLNGGFSPLTGYLGRADYESVLRELRLAGGQVWPIPVTLAVPSAVADMLEQGSFAALRDREGMMLARLQVAELWQPDLQAEAEAVYGTGDRAHPGVRRLLEGGEVVYVAGAVEGLHLPHHYDFTRLRFTPAQLRQEFERLGWSRVTGYQARGAVHRMQKEATTRAATQAGSHLLLHPAMSSALPGEGVDPYTLARSFEAVSGHFPPGLMKLALLHLTPRMAGPREALWQALIRKNHGCSHFIVEEHQGSPNANGGQRFYYPQAAQELVAGYQQEIGIEMVPLKPLGYSQSKAQYVPRGELVPGEEADGLSEQELQRRLRQGLEVPSWFSFPEVIAELRKALPPRSEQGFTLFFTGLSGAGKSTIANVLMARFLEMGERPVTLLDGDIVRRNLSSELGFSKEHRDLNILRIGFVANEITKNGGIAICAPIAPYRDIRRQVRETVSANGGFIEIYVSTPLEVCEKRDRKGLYAKARQGIIPNFTGVSDPYEAPREPEVAINTSEISPEESAEEIWLYLEREGYLA